MRMYENRTWDATHYPGLQKFGRARNFESYWSCGPAHYRIKCNTLNPILIFPPIVFNVYSSFWSAHFHVTYHAYRYALNRCCFNASSVGVSDFKAGVDFFLNRTWYLSLFWIQTIMYIWWVKHLMNSNMKRLIWISFTVYCFESSKKRNAYRLYVMTMTYLLFFYSSVWSQNNNEDVCWSYHWYQYISTESGSKMSGYTNCKCI